MDEAKRFIRYIIPGLVFLTVIFIIIWIIEPKCIQEFIYDTGFSPVFITLLGSGGLGFLFSMIHHFLYSLPQSISIDHKDFIIKLIERNIIQLRNSNKNDQVCETGDVEIKNMCRSRAWCILNGLWHERKEKCSSIRGAEQRAMSLSDIVHSIGTAKVAIMAAWIFAIIILMQECKFSLEGIAVIRFVYGNMLAFSLLIICRFTYIKAITSAQLFIEQVLYDSLMEEQRTRSIKTHVGL